MTPKISLIITVYNLEKRLLSLLQSLEAQTFQDFEAIFIDDASNDGSLNILNNFATKQHKFSVQVCVNQSNLGRSTSRNKGFNLSNGNFVCFLDGDDIIDALYLEKLYSAIDTGDSEIAICGYKTLEIATGKEELFSMVIDKTPNEILLGRVLSKIPLHHCGILFNKNFLKKTGIRYADGCEAGEDIEFVLKVLCRVKKIAFISDCLYIYVLHPQMSMRAHKKNSAIMVERYEQNTGAHMQAAQYLITHTTDKKVRALAKHMLLPTAYLRQLSVYAMQGKQDDFRQLLANKKIRSCLWHSYHCLLAKGEVFGKALLALLIPKIYYRYYSNKYK